jgi:hypothetical protein
MGFAFFIQHLDARIKEFALLLIIDEISIVKLDGICPGIAGNLIHFQVVLGDGKPIFPLRLGGHNENGQ